HQITTDPMKPGAAPTLGSLFIAFQSETAVRQLISELLEPAAATSDSARAFLLHLLPSLTAQKPEAAWLRAIPHALTNEVLRVAALSAATAYPQPDVKPMLAKLAEDSSMPAPQRLLAARVSARQPALSVAVFELAIDSLGIQAGA